GLLPQRHRGADGANVRGAAAAGRPGLPDRPALWPAGPPWPGTPAPTRPGVCLPYLRRPGRADGRGAGAAYPALPPALRGGPPGRGRVSAVLGLAQPAPGPADAGDLRPGVRLRTVPGERQPAG